jgi:hypothetical protein
MPHSLRRLLTYLGLALLEITPPALLLTLWGVLGAWSALLLAALGAALADGLARRFLPNGYQRFPVAVVALALSLSAAQVAVPDGKLSLALLDRTSPHNLIAYAGTLAGLYAAWRGVCLPLYQSVGLRELFARIMALSLLALLIGGASMQDSDGSRSAMATVEVLLGFAVGLATVALARATEPGETATRASGWRGTMPTLATVGLVLLIGLALAALLGGEARSLLYALGDLISFLLMLILVPLVMLVAPVLEWILIQIHATDLLRALQDFARQLDRSTEPPLDLFRELTLMFPWAGPLIKWIVRLLPILLLLALVWLVSQRKPRPAASDEERESIFSWQGLIDDLRGLFARRDQEGGLRAALARLLGDDPDTRIRRSYLRLLIAAEQRGAARPDPQTPREYTPTLYDALPDQHDAASRLTAAYERARYHPGTSTAADADAVEDRRPKTEDPRS